MSDVKRWEPENTFLGYNMRPDPEGSFVLHDHYAKLEAEAQALREEVAAYEDGMRSLACQLGAGGFNAETLTASQLLDKVQWGVNNLAETQGRLLDEIRSERDALRARVVVVPEPLNEGDARRECSEYGVAMQRGYSACLRELARLNGKVVSEADLRKWLELMEHGDFREGHCMCGSAVDSHGLGDGHSPVDAGEYYAGQVMEELRALLGEGKEVEDGSR